MVVALTEVGYTLLPHKLATWSQRLYRWLDRHILYGFFDWYRVGSVDWIKVETDGWKDRFTIAIDGTKHVGSESFGMQTYLDGANRLWGESSSVWAKRTVGETSGNPLHTWLNPRSLLRLTTSVMHTMPSRLLSSALTVLLCKLHLTIIRSVLSNLAISSTFIAEVSLAYPDTHGIQALHTFPFTYFIYIIFKYHVTVSL